MILKRLGSRVQQLIYRGGAGHHSEVRIDPVRLALLVAVLVVASGALGVAVGFSVADDQSGSQPVAARQLAPATDAGQGADGPTAGGSAVDNTYGADTTPGSDPGAAAGTAPTPGPASASTTPASSVVPPDQSLPATPEATDATEPAPGSLPAPVAVATDPVRLRVPAIEVDAPVIPLGLNPDQTLEVPTTASDTGWWTGGSAPGATGPAVIAGHVNLRSEAGVFAELDKMKEGDMIEVVGDDQGVVSFVVDRVERHPKDSFPTDRVYGPTGGPELRLITCGGAFDEGTGRYADNIIVFAHRAPAPA